MLLPVLGIARIPVMMSKEFIDGKIAIRTVVSNWLIGLDNNRIALPRENLQGINGVRFCRFTVGLDDRHAMSIN